MDEKIYSEGELSLFRSEKPAKVPYPNTNFQIVGYIGGSPIYAPASNPESTKRGDGHTEWVDSGYHVEEVDTDYNLDPETMTFTPAEVAERDKANVESLKKWGGA